MGGTKVPEVPSDRGESASELLRLLKGWDGQPQEYNTLLLISLSVLPLHDADDSFWTEINKTMVAYRLRHHTRYFNLSKPDRAMLAKMSEYNHVSLITDAKVELLRLVQQYFPEQFGNIDQSRLLRAIDLRFKLPNAIRFLERYEEQALEMESQPTAIRMRRLSEQDIERVVEVNQQIGNAAFAKVFIRHQKIASIQPGMPADDVMHEYFVGMDALKKHVFMDVELRGSGNLFNQLTITLDRLLLDAFGNANPERAKCSINLNVESVFSRAFEAFLGDSSSNAFSNLAFEFRQANVLQHYDEYEVAANLITSRNGSLAVDAVFPETVGIVNMRRLGANMTKIFWRQGAELILPRFRREIEAMLKSGIVVVLARVDDDLGIEIGHDLGITMFQGFRVDEMLRQRDT
ncbi:MAG: hypothetical protein O2944_09440 [Proteobacteria bacterium]|nr:hypothetical protein [Pseudomonadota bacterium]